MLNNPSCVCGFMRALVCEGWLWWMEKLTVRVWRVFLSGWPSENFSHSNEAVSISADPRYLGLWREAGAGIGGSKSFHIKQCNSIYIGHNHLCAVHGDKTDLGKEEVGVGYVGLFSAADLACFPCPRMAIFPAPDKDLSVTPSRPSLKRAPAKNKYIPREHSH